jgi:hypothetical protein
VTAPDARKSAPCALGSPRASPPWTVTRTPGGWQITDGRALSAVADPGSGDEVIMGSGA